MPRPRPPRPKPAPSPPGRDDSPENLRRIGDDLMRAFDEVDAQLRLKERQARLSPASMVVAPAPLL